MRAAWLLASRPFVYKLFIIHPFAVTLTLRHRRVAKCPLPTYLDEQHSRDGVQQLILDRYANGGGAAPHVCVWIVAKRQLAP